MRPQKIIVHHSLTEDSWTVSWGAIRRFHTETRGWLDIGYHAGVELVKSGRELYYEGIFGRPWDMQGAHTLGENYNSLGICCIGNFDIREPPQGQLKIAAKIIKLWMDLYAIGIDDVYGHRDFASYKSCPGEKFDMGKLKDIIRG